MKKLITLLCFVISLNAYAQEQLNKFYVIDKDTHKVITPASITIVRAKLSITTEESGVFVIPGNLAIMRDTVIVSAQNYYTYRVLLNRLYGVDTIRLTRAVITRATADAKYKDDTLLNDFKRRDIVHFAGFDTDAGPFEYLQMAQRFEIKRDSVKLKSVEINRLAFNGFVDDFRNYEDIEQTIFRIRVYDIDPVSGGPGADLCDQVIEEHSTDGKQLAISLKKYNILIPHKTFYVAVEWKRDYVNYGVIGVFDPEKKKDKPMPNYRPALGISPNTGKKLNIWGMKFNHQWKPYNYFMPFGTDLAMKATVEY